ncbi:MAG TPA: iron-containing redox enzyme family protein [Chloroflexota bacterium]|nr:iron-containing redox enzyme family protein [Chloroflexota bacterium]HZU05430.1 iron-containing redox enzyme family protein [Chloroflexota bacterium]
MATESPVLSSAEFVRQLKEEIARSPKQRVNHPFVRAVCAGTATLDEIRRWAIQDYQFRRAVPRIAMLRYLACTDPEFSAKLFEVVEEETRGLRPGSAGHAEMFLEFADYLGIRRDELDNAPLLPATAAHLYYAELIIHTLPWFVVMAAQMGAEGTFPPAAAALGQGLIQNYGVPPEKARFFTVHTEADEEHGALAEQIALRYLTAPELQALTRQVTLRRMELLYDVWSIDY